MSTFARVNEYGFVETPYRRVAEGKVTEEVRWYSALEEEGHDIAQANAAIDQKSSKLGGALVSARYNGEFVMVPPEDITLMDVSPNQLVSVAASLIPFLEHDDANRALMGSNMQRQAVPLSQCSAPIVGTGMEAQRRPRLGRHRRGQARRHGRVGRRDPHRGQGRGRGPGRSRTSTG